MKIQTKILLSVAISIAISIAVVFIIVHMFQHMEKEEKLGLVYDRIEDNTYAINLLTARFLNQPNAGFVHQIRYVQKSLDNLLAAMNPTNAREKILARQIKTNCQEFGFFIDKLISGSLGHGSIEAEQYNFFVSQLWMKAQFISDDAHRLLTISKSRLAADRHTVDNLSIALIAMLILVNAAIYFFSSKRIIRVQKELQLALSKAEKGDQLLSTLMEQIPEGIMIADADLKLTKISRYGQKFLEDLHHFDMNPEEFVLQWKAYYAEGKTPLVFDILPLVRSIQHGEIIRDTEIIHMDAHGKPLHMLCSSGPIRDNAGKITGGIVIFHDISERKQTLNALLESEKQLSEFNQILSGILEHTHIMAVYLDTAFNFIWVNRSYADTCRNEPSFFPGKNHFDLYPYKETQSIFQQVVDTGKPFYARAKPFVFPDKTERGITYWDWSLIPVLDDTAKVIGLVFTLVEVTDRIMAEKALSILNETLEQKVNERTELAESRAKQLQVLAAELIEAEERERRRLAEFMHEDLQQIIASALMQLQTFHQRMYYEPMLAKVEKLLSESISKSRHLTQELSPPILHHSSFTAVLEWLSQQMSKRFGLQVSIESNTEAQIENWPIKLFMFRAVQELLFNVVKHSGTKSAWVDFSVSDEEIKITVRDYGCGFNPDLLNSATLSSGFGLLSLRERASYIGSSFMIESTPANGTCITLKVPLSLIESLGIKRPERDQRSRTQVYAKDSNDTKCTRVLFVDDHRVMRQGLIQLMKGKPNIQVVGEAANGREAIERVRQLKPDVVVMDINMPEMNGIEATRCIKAEWPEIRVIGLSMYDDKWNAKSIRDAGAEAFVCKSASSSVLLKAIYGIANNNGQD